MKQLFEILILAALGVTGYCGYHFILGYNQIKPDIRIQIIGVLIVFVILCVVLVYFYLKWFPQEQKK